MTGPIPSEVWAFDVEWVPDAVAGRALYGADAALPEGDILSIMWRHGGATVEEPRPFLKTVVCRIVSIAIVRRSRTEDGVCVEISSLPADVNDPAQSNERAMIASFLQDVSRHRPQLVGFNATGADMNILMQRAVVHGLPSSGVDGQLGRRTAGYFQGSEVDGVIDLMRMLGGRGRSVPSLHELAVLSGIPGKLGVDGSDVARLWLQGRHRRIVDYNECDALTTYLLWLRVAHFTGQLATSEYEREQDIVSDLLERRAASSSGSHLRAYLDEWRRLESMQRRSWPGLPVNGPSRT